MWRVVSSLWGTLGAYYYEIITWTAINLLWFVGGVVLPAFGIATFLRTPFLLSLLFAFVLCIAAPPSVAALFYVARRYEDGENIAIRDFFTGFRQFFWRSWQLALVDVVVGALVIVNIWFYGTHGTGFVKLIDIIWLYLLLFFFLVQPFAFGLLVFQTDRRLRNTVRNSFLLVFDNLGTSLSLLFVGVIVEAISVLLLLPLIAFSGLVGAMWVTRVLDGLLAKYPNARRNEQDGDGQSRSPLAEIGRHNVVPVSPEAQRSRTGRSRRGSS
ncbi:MAG: YesL family protein [Chloroflexi bacterium]|nr:YesL family protein [Chloroflexota bacterium]